MSLHAKARAFDDSELITGQTSVSGLSGPTPLQRRYGLVSQAGPGVAELQGTQLGPNRLDFGNASVPGDGLDGPVPTVAGLENPENSWLTSYEDALGNFLGGQLYELVAELLSFQNLSELADSGSAALVAALIEEARASVGADQEAQLTQFGAALVIEAQKLAQQFLHSETGLRLVSRLHDFAEANPLAIAALAILIAFAVNFNPPMVEGTVDWGAVQLSAGIDLAPLQELFGKAIEAIYFEIQVKAQNIEFRARFEDNEEIDPTVTAALGIGQREDVFLGVDATIRRLTGQGWRPESIHAFIVSRYGSEFLRLDYQFERGSGHTGTITWKLEGENEVQNLVITGSFAPNGAITGSATFDRTRTDGANTATSSVSGQILSRPEDAGGLGAGVSISNQQREGEEIVYDFLLEAQYEITPGLSFGRLEESQRRELALGVVEAMRELELSVQRTPEGNVIVASASGEVVYTLGEFVAVARAQGTLRIEPGQFSASGSVNGSVTRPDGDGNVVTDASALSGNLDVGTNTGVGGSFQQTTTIADPEGQAQVIYDLLIEGRLQLTPGESFVHLREEQRQELVFGVVETLRELSLSLTRGTDGTTFVADASGQVRYTLGEFVAVAQAQGNLRIEPGQLSASGSVNGSVTRPDGNGNLITDTAALSGNLDIGANTGVGGSFQQTTTITDAEEQAQVIYDFLLEARLQLTPGESFIRLREEQQHEVVLGVIDTLRELGLSLTRGPDGTTFVANASGQFKYTLDGFVVSAFAKGTLTITSNQATIEGQVGTTVSETREDGSVLTTAQSLGGSISVGQQTGGAFSFSDVTTLTNASGDAQVQNALGIEFSAYSITGQGLQITGKVNVQSGDTTIEASGTVRQSRLENAMFSIRVGGDDLVVTGSGTVTIDAQGNAVFAVEQGFVLDAGSQGTVGVNQSITGNGDSATSTFSLDFNRLTELMLRYTRTDIQNGSNAGSSQETLSLTAQKPGGETASGLTDLSIDTTATDGQITAASLQAHFRNFVAGSPWSNVVSFEVANGVTTLSLQGNYRSPELVDALVRQWAIDYLVSYSGGRISAEVAGGVLINLSESLDLRVDASLSTDGTAQLTALVGMDINDALRILVGGTVGTEGSALLVGPQLGRNGPALLLQIGDNQGGGALGFRFVLPL